MTSQERLSAIRKDAGSLIYLSDGTSGADKVARLLEAVPELLDEVNRLQGLVEYWASNYQSWVDGAASIWEEGVLAAFLTEYSAEEAQAQVKGIPNPYANGGVQPMTGVDPLDFLADVWDAGLAAGINHDLGDREQPPSEIANPYRKKKS